MMPAKTTKLQDRIFKFEMHPKLAKHKSIQIIDTINDYYNMNAICYNITSEPYNIPKHTVLVTAHTLTSETLPELHIQGEVLLSAVSVLPLEKSPKQQAEEAFSEALTAYDQYPDLQSVLREFKNVFVQPEEYSLPKLKIDPVKIPVKSVKGYIMPTPQMRERHYKEIDIEAIETFVEAGIINDLIEECISPVQNPLHVVRTAIYDVHGKQTGTKTRITADCRKNNIVNCAMFNYAFPTIDEELAKLTSHDAKFFNSMDLSQGFHQIEVHRDSRPLFAFPIYDGKFKGRTFCYKRLLFGWASAPAIFSNILTKIFVGLESSDVDAKCSKYIDDIAYSCKSWNDQLLFTRRFLSRCQAYGVALNIKKCTFAAETVSFCGHSVSQKGITISPKRVSILRDYPDFDVRSRRKNADLTLYGFYGYHSKWVNNYSKKERAMKDAIEQYKTKQIDAQTCNDKIKSITDAIKKEVLACAVVTPNKQDTVTLVTDSSGRSWGSVLYCDRGIIAYSAGTHAVDIIRTHSIYLLELRTLSLAVQKMFKLMSMAGDIIIKTDNFSATFCLSKRAKPKISTRALQYIQNITMWLANFHPKIVHLGTKENKLCDALSRLSYNAQGEFTQHEELPHPSQFFGKIREEIAAVRKQAKLPEYPATKTAIGGTAFQISQMGKTEQEHEDFVKRIHKSTHWSEKKMSATLRSAGFNIATDIVKRVSEQCITCNNPRKVAPLSKLHPKPTPHEPFDELHIDFVDKKANKSSSRGHIGILTMICVTTRYAFAIPMKRLTIQPVIEQLRLIFSILGRKCSSIYADNAFQYGPLQDFCEKSNITISFRASNLSRSVLVERFHRTLHDKLSSFTPHNSGDWDIYLHDAVISLNAQLHDSTGFTPYFLLFGHQHPLLRISDSKETLKETNQTWQDCLLIARTISDSDKIKRADFKYNFPQFDADAKVLVKYDPSKNGEYKEATVVEDDGGAELKLKFSPGGQIFKVHKGMIHVSKGTNEYESVFNSKKLTKRKIDEDDKDGSRYNLRPRRR